MGRRSDGARAEENRPIQPEGCWPAAGAWKRYRLRNRGDVPGEQRGIVGVRRGRMCDAMRPGRQACQVPEPTRCRRGGIGRRGDFARHWAHALAGSSPAAGTRRSQTLLTRRAGRAYGGCDVRSHRAAGSAAPREPRGDCSSALAACTPAAVGRAAGARSGGTSGTDEEAGFLRAKPGAVRAKRAVRPASAREPRRRRPSRASRPTARARRAPATWRPRTLQPTASPAASRRPSAAGRARRTRPPAARDTPGPAGSAPLGLARPLPTRAPPR